MDKQKWIDWYTSGRYAETKKDVVTFIADFLFSGREIGDIFSSGYCYYFAVMLKTAFNRGTVCWHRNYGHIVWQDEDGIAYDINGVFDDYAEGDLLDVETSLGDMLVDFKHNGAEYRAGSKRFHDWAEHYKMTDLCALSDIYRNMPREEIDDNETVETNAFRYWIGHELELSEYYQRKKRERHATGNIL